MVRVLRTVQHGGRRRRRRRGRGRGGYTGTTANHFEGRFDRKAIRLPLPTGWMEIEECGLRTAECSVWKMWSMEKCGVWKMRSIIIFCEVHISETTTANLVFVTEVLPFKLSDIRIDNALYALFTRPCSKAGPSPKMGSVCFYYSAQP